LIDSDASGAQKIPVMHSTAVGLFMARDADQIHDLAAGILRKPFSR